VSCWSVRTGLPLFAHVKIFCKSANPSNPGVERSHVWIAHVWIAHVVISPVVCIIHVNNTPVLAIVHVDSSILSRLSVLSEIVDSPPNIPITFAFMFWYSNGYMVASTYADAPAKIANMANVFILPLL